jgi:hypothetical protein
MNSQTKPVPNSNMAAATKSKAVQFTSLVNCMAINGMDSKTVATKSMISNRLFFIVVVVGETVFFSIKKGSVYIFKSTLKYKVNINFQLLQEIFSVRLLPDFFIEIFIKGTSRSSIVKQWLNHVSFLR